MLTLTSDGRPPEIPQWAPTTSEELTVDFLVREWMRIAMDSTQPTPIRMKAMEALSKHAGFSFERVEVRTIDESRSRALESMFDSMTPAEKEQWLQAQTVEAPKEIAVSNLAPALEELRPVREEPLPIPATAEPTLKTAKAQMRASLPEFLKR